MSGYDVAIVGGGIAGCAIARELSRYRLKLVLLESRAEVGFGVSKANSGIIHAGHHEPEGSLKGDLAAQGNRLYTDLAAELGFAFARIGELVVALTPGELPVLERLKCQGEARGLEGLEIWDARRLRREEPNLSHDLLAALHVPSAGVINPYEACFALAASAARNGVEIACSSPVQAIHSENGRLILTTPDRKVEARFVINAAGLQADRVAELAGVRDFTIHPRKGEEYLLDRRLQGIVRRLIFPTPSPLTKGILIIPTFDGTVMVGPTAVDTTDRDDLETSTAGARTIFEQVRRYCPGISERDTIAEFAGLRPVSNSGEFIIGPSRVKGFLNCAGIQSPGLTAAPAIARLMVRILRDEGLALEERRDWRNRVEPPTRFARLNSDQRRELAVGDPRFGRVVCRCETVTEAEVVWAIRQGARTLDGVKFRVRPGMGRCQGGFCTPRVIEILARELAIPEYQVTKRGPGSEIFYPRAVAVPSDPDARVAVKQR